MKCALCIFANVQNCKRLGDKWMSPYLDLCFTTLQQIYIDLGECLRILNVASSHIDNDFTLSIFPFCYTIDILSIESKSVWFGLTLHCARKVRVSTVRIADKQNSVFSSSRLIVN